MMKGNRTLKTVLALGLALILMAGLGVAQEAAPQAEMGSAFTYQGRLEDGGSLVNDTCDCQFSLFGSSGGTDQIGSTQSATNVTVNSGYFSVDLDFGTDAFSGEARWLEVQVRCPAGSGDYTILSPRQPLNPTPYALHAGSIADGAVTASKIGEPCQAGQVLAYTGSDWQCVTAVLDATPTQQVSHDFETDPVAQSVTGPAGQPGQTSLKVDLATLGVETAATWSCIGGGGCYYSSGINEVLQFDVVCQDSCSDMKQWHHEVLQAGNYFRNVTVRVLDGSGSDYQTWNLTYCWPANMEGELSPDGTELYLRYTVVCDEINTYFAGLLAREDERTARTATSGALAAPVGAEVQAADSLPRQQVPHGLSFSGITLPGPGGLEVDLTMLHLETDVHTFIDPGNPYYKLHQAGPTQPYGFDVTCIQDCSALDTWYQEVLQGIANRRAGDLDVRDAMGETVHQWELYNCWPQALGATLNQDGTVLYRKYTMVCDWIQPTQ